MRGSFTLGRMLGIPILLHYSWLLIAALIVFSLAAHFTVSQPGWSGSTIWTAAAATTALFFLSLVLHELAHAVVARRAGLPVHSITLFALGGLARITRDASRPGVEFAVAAVGPLASVLIGIVCTAAAAALRGGETAPVTPAVVMLDWLGYINFVLAGFNLLPAFPLDGGRVLRAIVWRVTGSASRATRIAAATGLVVAVALIGLGLFVAFTTGSFGGLWLAILGWFLSQAAAASRVQLDIAEELRDVRVGEVMARDCTIVDPGMPLQEFVDDLLLRSGSRCFVAAREGQVGGLVTPADVRRVDRSEWDRLRVNDVMRPLGDVQSVTPEHTAADAFELMARDDLNQLPVVDRGNLLGVVSRGHIFRLLQQRAALAS